MNIHVGDEIELTEEVVPENTAEKWGSGSLPVYATPAMISLIEQSAVNLLAGKLEEGQTTVGTNLNIAHVSATPVGGTIKCHCSLTEIDRKRLVFHVEVTDNKGRVGIGTHKFHANAGNSWSISGDQQECKDIMGCIDLV